MDKAREDREAHQREQVSLHGDSNPPVGDEVDAYLARLLDECDAAPEDC